jgi:hypothetical protein
VLTRTRLAGRAGVVRLGAVSRLLALILLCSCASTATLTTTRGTVEATILGGDDESLLVINEAGAKKRVPRDQVQDIDHPGNVVATIFGPAGALFGIETIAFAIGPCRTDLPGGGTGPSFCVIAGGIAAVSLGLAAWGLYTWITSRNAVTHGLPADEGPMSKYPLAFPGAEPAAPLPPPPLVPPPSL